MKKAFLIALVLALIGTTVTLMAQDTAADALQLLQNQAGGEQATPKLLTQLAVLAGIAVLPFAVMLLTSYVKVVIVLSLLRNALGVQQSPPNQVLNGIALLVTVYVMFPTGLAMYNAAGDYIRENQPEVLFSGPTAGYLINVAD
nr:Flagellar biosynthetic protein FliP [Chlamydiota bacterium]